MTKIFTIVIILLLSFSRIYAETINNEPIEIWSEDQVNDLNEVDNSKTADSEQSHIDSSSTISQAKIEYSAYDTIGLYDKTKKDSNRTVT